MLKNSRRFGPSLGPGTGRSPVVNQDSMSFAAAKRGREFAGGYGTNTKAFGYYLRLAHKWFWRTHF